MYPLTIELVGKIAKAMRYEGPEILTAATVLRFNPALAIVVVV